MEDIKEYFEILGLELGASLDEVNEAYGDLVKVSHLDRFTDDPKLQKKAQERLKEIDEAYQKIQEFLKFYSYQEATTSEKRQYTKTEETFKAKNQQAESANAHDYESNAEPPSANRQKNVLFALFVVCALILIAILASGVLKVKDMKNNTSGNIKTFEEELENLRPMSNEEYQEYLKQRQLPFLQKVEDVFLKQVTDYIQSESSERMISNYSLGIELNPNNIRNFHNRGLAYYSLGNFQQSMQDFSKEIELSPSSQRGYIFRGFCYARLGIYPKAIKDYNKAIEVEPDKGMAYFYRGAIYNEFGNAEQGINDLKIAARLGYKPAQDSLNLRGVRW